MKHNIANYVARCLECQRVKVEHQHLAGLLQPNLNARQRQWMEFLCEYDFEVKYIQGKENVVENFLSCRRHEVSSITLSVNLRSQIL